MAQPTPPRTFFAARRTTAWAALAAIAVILVSVNVIAARFLSLRLDLTAEHLYTLSSGTSRTLAKIGEPATVKMKTSAAVTTKAMTWFFVIAETHAPTARNAPAISQLAM